MHRTTISRRLWRLLEFPLDQHPMYTHIKFARQRIDLRLVWGLVAALAVWVTVTNPSLAMALLLISPAIFTMFSISVNGCVWAVNIAQAVARQRRNGAYDLICLIPQGGVLTNWVILSEALHHREILRRSYDDMVVLVQFMVFIPLILGVGALTDPSDFSRLGTLTTLITVIGLMVVIAVDFVQSVLTSSLIGCVVGNLVRNVGNARLWSAVGVIVAQLSCYSLLVVSLVSLSVAFQAFRIDSFAVRVILLAGVFGGYLALREALVWGLWRWLNHLLNCKCSDSLAEIRRELIH